MQVNNSHIVVSYIENLPGDSFECFKADVEEPGLRLLIEARRPTIYAALEWLMPTVVVAYIAKPYFESFLKEMGKDHYLLLKSGLKKLGIKFLGKNAPQINVIQRKGKIEQSQKKYSFAFSVMTEISEQLRAKLLFDANFSEDESAHALERFLEWVEHLQSGATSLSELKGFSDVLTIGGTILIAFNPEENKLEAVDPLPKKGHSNA